MSNSLQPHGLKPTRLLCSWDFPGKNTGVGSHSLLQKIFLIQGSNPCLLSPALQADSLWSEPPGKPGFCIKMFSIALFKVEEKVSKLNITVEWLRNYSLTSYSATITL